MKYLSFFILLLFPLVGICQMSDTSSETLTLEKINCYQSSLNLQNNKADLTDEIKHLRFCLNKYRKEKLTGIWLTVGGGFVAGVSSSLYQLDVLESNTAMIGYITGGAMLISGNIMKLTSHRWLKKAYIGPADSGIGLAFNF